MRIFINPIGIVIDSIETDISDRLGLANFLFNVQNQLYADIDTGFDCIEVIVQKHKHECCGEETCFCGL